MVAGRKHIKLQYEWAEKLKKDPYNCDFVEMEHKLEIGFDIYYSDVYGKNISTNQEYVVEVGKIQYEKGKIFEEVFKDHFITVNFQDEKRKHLHHENVPKKKNMIPVRLDNELLEMIDRYACLHDMDRSKAFRELLRYGLVNRANIELQERWNEMITARWLEIQEQTTKLINEGQNLIYVRDHYMCQKCHGTINLQVYHIDRDPLNSNPNNLLTLCKDCISKAEKFTPKRRVIEDFLEWYYLL